MFFRFRLLVLASTLLFLAACSGKSVPPRDGHAPAWMGTIADLRQFPQNLEIYAQNVGPDKHLISQTEQGRQHHRRRIHGPGLE